MLHGMPLEVVHVTKSLPCSEPCRVVRDSREIARLGSGRVSMLVRQGQEVVGASKTMASRDVAGCQSGLYIISSLVLQTL